MKIQQTPGGGSVNLSVSVRDETDHAPVPDAVA